MADSSQPTNDDTLGHSREWLKERLWKGARCPCCEQYARIYKRKLNKTMVKALGRVYRATAAGRGFTHGPTVLKGSGVFGGDLGKLAYFGLVEEEAGRREDGGRKGWWRVTNKGRAFIQGHLALPKYAHIYDGRVLGFSGDPVEVADVAPRFSFVELMGSV